MGVRSTTSLGGQRDQRDLAVGAAHERDLTASISPAAWEVLYALRARGHESYVVGGTVRDYLLGSETKDVDVCTSATPEQVKALFSRSRVLGRRFPIVHVRQNKETIEVSSFRTNCDDPSVIPLDWYQQQQLRAKYVGVRRRRGSDGGDRDNGGNGSLKGGKRTATVFRDSVLSTLRDEATGDWSTARRQNAFKRDFTINGMLYDPFARVLFDYVDGIQDCERRVLRTIQSPGDSFQEDPARILRAIRLAARLNLDIADETREEMLKQKERIGDLNHGRLQMELGAMFAYGSAEATYKALQDFDLVRLLLPHHYARRDALPLRVLRLMDDCVQSMRQPLASVTYNGALFTMLVMAELAQVAEVAEVKPASTSMLSAIDVVDEMFDRVTAPKQAPKQLLARKALEQTSYLLREQLLLIERGGPGGSRRSARRSRKAEKRTATHVLEDIIGRALQALSG